MKPQGAKAEGLGLAEAFRRHAPEALATLIRLVGDFDLAEEGLQEAFAAAAVAWAATPPDKASRRLPAVAVEVVLLSLPYEES